ncbi:MAG TPA: hypothetical protein VH796_00425 [Nitrososphaeraceae archaeon]|jgi:hypothetical protein
MVIFSKCQLNYDKYDNETQRYYCKFLLALRRILNTRIFLVDFLQISNIALDVITFPLSNHLIMENDLGNILSKENPRYRMDVLSIFASISFFGDIYYNLYGNIRGVDG